jgi:hypothetical protein
MYHAVMFGERLTTPSSWKRTKRWQTFAEWVKTLPGRRYSQLRHFAAQGSSQQARAVKRELASAIAARPPSPAVVNGFRTLTDSLLQPIIIGGEAVRFAKRIGVADDVDTLAHVNCGLHSGFPKCCILFFLVRRWFDDREGKGYDQIQEALGVQHPGYVVCPSCLLEERVVKPKNCRPRCNDSLVIEFSEAAMKDF